MRSALHWLCIFAGSLAVALGIAGFLTPNHFIDGGVTGVSMLAAEQLHQPKLLPLFLVLVNAPFVFLGYRRIGPAFAVKTIVGIVAVAVWLAVIPFPKVTEDKLLAGVFGGVFIGGGVGLALRGGGVLDGTEILAVLLSRKTFATVGEIILALNVIIFAAAALFLGVEPAMYSVLTYFTAFKTIDFLMHGLEAYTGVMIVSDEHEPIREALLSELGRGVTVLKAFGGYTATERRVLYCVVTRLELTKLEGIVKQHDPTAFVVISPVHEVTGGTVKRRGGVH